MENKKEKGSVNLITLVILLVVILALGLIIGFLAAQNVELSKGTQEIPVSSVAEKNTMNDLERMISSLETSSQTDKVVTPSYDGSKTIEINGKTYTISYNSDIYQYDSDYPVVVNLYFNDQKVRSIDMPIQSGNIDKGEKFNKEYSVELHNIKNEYILVIIKNKSKEFDYEYARLCVLNLNGEFIGAKEWVKGPEGVSRKSDNKNLVRYEVYDDGFLVFETSKWGGVYYEARYYVKDNSIILGNESKFYQADEVTTAGK